VTSLTRFPATQVADSLVTVGNPNVVPLEPRPTRARRMSTTGTGSSQPAGRATREQDDQVALGRDGRMRVGKVVEGETRFGERARLRWVRRSIGGGGVRASPVPVQQRELVRMEMFRKDLVTPWRSLAWSTVGRNGRRACTCRPTPAICPEPSLDVLVPRGRRLAATSSH